MGEVVSHTNLPCVGIGSSLKYQGSGLQDANMPISQMRKLRLLESFHIHVLTEQKLIPRSADLAPGLQGAAEFCDHRMQKGYGQEVLHMLDKVSSGSPGSVSLGIPSLPRLLRPRVQ